MRISNIASTTTPPRKKNKAGGSCRDFELCMSSFMGDGEITACTKFV